MALATLAELKMLQALPLELGGKMDCLSQTQIDSLLRAISTEELILNEKELLKTKKYSLIKYEDEYERKNISLYDFVDVLITIYGNIYLNRITCYNKEEINI